MFKQGNRRLSAILMALAVVIANVIAPVMPAFADSHEELNQTSKLKQVYCNIEGTSGKWKAQIGSKHTEHEFPLKDAQGNFVYIHDENDLKDMNADCEAQAVATTPTYNATPTCNANDPVSWVYDITKLTMNPTAPIYVGNVISATFTPISPYTLKDVNGHIISSLTLTYTDIQPSNCIVKDATADVAVSDPTCTSSSVVTIDENKTSHAHLVGALNQSVGEHAATFAADNGYLFANGQTTITVWYRILPHEVGMQCAGPKPADRETRTQTSDAICLPGGGGVVVTWTEERFRYVRFDSMSNQWKTTSWSPWVPARGTKTEVPATDTECPKPTQTQPTCETDGTLTLPAYKGEWHEDYKYIVTIGLIVKTYDADKTVTINNIPQGAHVFVKLVSDDCFHKVIFSKEYDFDIVDCIIATPEQPQTNDECGPDNAFWIVPADTTDVHWSVNSDGHLIATAIGGHFAGGATTIDYGVTEDSNEPCPPSSTPATPVKPHIIDCEVILPITLGITYTKVYLDANGNIINPNLPGVIVAHEGVLATANPGYVLTPGNDGGKWLDNGGYLYILDFTGLNCGGGSVTPPVVTPPVVTPPTVTPPTVTPVSASLPAPAELPRTGSSLSGLLVTFLATLTTYGIVYVLQPKRR